MIFALWVILMGVNFVQGNNDGYFLYSYSLLSAYDVTERTVYYYWHKLNDAVEEENPQNLKIQKMQFSSTNVATCLIGKLSCLLYG